MGHDMQRVPSTALSGPDSASHPASRHMDAMHTANDQSLPNGASQANGTSQDYHNQGAEPWTQNGAGGDTESSGSDAELPQVDAKMIPLSITISRLITYAYTEL
ncbi:hypothetical protein IW148_005621, partial [Coemansia sp. RSA 1199]